MFSTPCKLLMQQARFHSLMVLKKKTQTKKHFFAGLFVTSFCIPVPDMNSNSRRGGKGARSTEEQY